MKDTKNFLLIDEETGEIVKIKELLKDKGESKISKHLIDAMIKQCGSIKEVDVELLYLWVKITKQVNLYGQIRLHGSQRDVDLEKEMIKDATILCYVYRILYSTHPFNSAIMLSEREKVSSWNQLWELIDCKRKSTRAKVKKFLTENALVREIVVYEGNKKKSRQFYLNPFLLRTSGYASQVAINCFKDCANLVQLDKYALLFLQCVGIIDQNIIKIV